MSKRYATEEEIAHIPDGAYRRLNFGRGLYLLCLKKGYRYWQFRMRVNGKEVAHPLGAFSDISFETARHKADQTRARLIRLRGKLADQTLDGKLERVPGKKNGYKTDCFRSAADACAFSLGLITQRVDKEIAVALNMLLWVPASWREICRARWEEMPVTSTSWFWIWHPAKQGRNKGSALMNKAYFFPRSLRETLLAYKQEQDGDWLFPSLATQKATELRKTLEAALRQSWPTYPLDLAGFKEFMGHFCNEQSNFKKTFISAVVSGRPSKRFHATQIEVQALMDWWEAAVLGSPPLNAEVRTAPADLPLPSI
jgi:hypothetical protein